MNRIKRITLALGILTLIAIVTITITEHRQCRQTSTLDFEPLDDQIAQLDRVYEKWFGEKFDVLQYNTATHMLCDWFLTQALSATSNENWIASLDTFLANAMDFAVNYGINTNYWAGETAYQWLENAINDPNSRNTLLQLCTPSHPQLQNVIDDNLNLFRAIAQNENLLDQNGHIPPHHRKITRLIHRSVWVEASRHQFPIARIQPPEEALAILRWKIERANIPLDQKLLLIHKYQNPSPFNYDFTLATAILLYKNALPDDARAILQNSLNTTTTLDDTKIQRYKSAIEFIDNDKSACLND